MATSAEQYCNEELFSCSHPAQSRVDQKQAVPQRSHPAQSGEDRFGPPTLERSGSEHRVGRFPSSSLRGEDRDERWSPL